MVIDIGVCGFYDTCQELHNGLAPLFVDSGTRCMALGGTPITSGEAKILHRRWPEVSDLLTDPKRVVFGRVGQSRIVRHGDGIGFLWKVRLIYMWGCPATEQPMRKEYVSFDMSEHVDAEEDCAHAQLAEGTGEFDVPWVIAQAIRTVRVGRVRENAGFKYLFRQMRVDIADFNMRRPKIRNKEDAPSHEAWEAARRYQTINALIAAHDCFKYTKQCHMGITAADLIRLLG